MGIATKAAAKDARADEAAREAKSARKGKDKAAKASKADKLAHANGKDRSKSAKAKLKFESAMPRDEAVAYFEAIIAGLRKGAIQFRRGEETLAVAPAGHVEIEVKASRKGAKESVSFEIAWRTEGTDLTISAS